MNRRGVTLVELLITVVIGSIAFFALSVPFVTERSMWASGKAQTEAQRDAQFVLRAMARQARQSTGYIIGGADPNWSITFDVSDCDGNPATPDPGEAVFEKHGDLLHLHYCGGEADLIDGVRSKVIQFTPSPVAGTTKLVEIEIDVVHKDRENEHLITQLYLRNAT
jgi:prepilin-type N-terminal cleavage/methylation domain-containing protein